MATKNTKKPTKPSTPPGVDDKPAEVEVAEVEKPIDTTQLERVRVTDNRLQLLFESSKPTAEQAEQIRRINAAAAAFAQVVTNETRNGDDRRVAIRKIKEASMTAIVGVMHNS